MVCRVCRKEFNYEDAVEFYASVNELSYERAEYFYNRESPICEDCQREEYNEGLSAWNSFPEHLRNEIMED